ncbi:MAG: hypothetical protein ACKVQW_10055 [Pyrinomonadaceae bacterium]
MHGRSALIRMQAVKLARFHLDGLVAPLGAAVAATTKKVTHMTARTRHVAGKSATSGKLRAEAQLPVGIA